VATAIALQEEAKKKAAEEAKLKKEGLKKLAMTKEKAWDKEDFGYMQKVSFPS
jgi:hypothetical protein